MRAPFASLLFLGLAFSLPALADTVTVNFEGPGANLANYSAQGISFSGNAMAFSTINYNAFSGGKYVFVDAADANCAANDGAGTCTVLKAPFSDNNVLQGKSIYSVGGTKWPEAIVMNVQDGITGDFTFQSSGSNQDIFVDVYSGLNGNGALLGSVFVPTSGTGVLNSWSNEIALDPSFLITLNGVTGYSVVFHQGTLPDLTGQSNGAGYIEFDNISFTNAGIPAVPEPGTLALLTTGALGLLGSVKRRLA